MEQLKTEVLDWESNVEDLNPIIRRTIISDFPLVSDLLDKDNWPKLKKIDGLDIDTIKQIVRFAKTEHNKHMEIQNSIQQAIEEVDGDNVDMESSDSVFAISPEHRERNHRIDQIKDQKQYVLRQDKIDKYTLRRKRIILSPSVCPECGYDVCETEGLGPFEDLSPSDQKKVKRTIKAHQIQVCNASVRKIITEDELRGLSSLSPKIMAERGLTPTH